MAMFDPTKKHSDGGSDEEPPAGTHLIAMVFFTRERGKAKGTPYLRSKFEVVHGPYRKYAFWTNLMMNVEKPGTAARLSAFSGSVGNTQPFDTEDDRAISMTFLKKPFKARLKKVPNGQHINTEIGRFFQDGEVSDAERAAMDNWASEQEEDGQWGGSSSSDFDGRDGFGGGGRPDDDIPF